MYTQHERKHTNSIFKSRIRGLVGNQMIDSIAGSMWHGTRQHQTINWKIGASVWTKHWLACVVIKSILACLCIYFRINTKYEKIKKKNIPMCKSKSNKSEYEYKSREKVTCTLVDLNQSNWWSQIRWLTDWLCLTDNTPNRKNHHLTNHWNIAKLLPNAHCIYI